MFLMLDSLLSYATDGPFMILSWTLFIIREHLIYFSGLQRWYALKHYRFNFIYDQLQGNITELIYSLLAADH